MITDDGLGKEVVDALARTDVKKYGYRAMSPALPLIEGYTPEMVDIQDRIARIVFSAVLGALQQPSVVSRGGVVFSNAVALTVGVMLAETGWTDENSENKIEVKRDAG